MPRTGTFTACLTECGLVWRSLLAPRARKQVICVVLRVGVLPLLRYQARSGYRVVLELEAVAARVTRVCVFTSVFFHLPAHGSSRRQHSIRGRW